MEAPAVLRSADSSLGDLATRARAVAAIAANNAVDVDAAARFPSEACAALKQQRLLGVMVPREFGGEGATIADVADICYVLGQSCSSTGMVYALHQIKIACVTRHMHDNKVLGDMMRRLCAEQLLLASSTTEGQSGGNVRSSEAPVEHVDGRISLERKASVISYGAYADGIVTTARRSADAVGSDQVLVAFLKSDYTLTRLQGWNTLGMRGTCSEGYTLKATGQPGQILPDPYEIIHAQTMVPFAHLLWGSVWTGIAANATARAQAFIRQAMRGGNGQLPPGAPQFTKALASLRTLRGMLATSLRTYERNMNDPKALGSVEFQSLITMTKVEASEHAVGIVLSALRACGLSGYRADGDFTIGRHLRDVLSSPIMINNDRILANLATSSLMAPIPASMRD
jgi:acyl-CoA dehydrogenase